MCCASLVSHIYRALGTFVTSEMAEKSKVKNQSFYICILAHKFGCGLHIFFLSFIWVNMDLFYLLI